MKKTLAVLAFVMLFCSQAFATYIVVLTDGTRYKAKARWTIANGKALVTLENGQVLTLNPNEIDAAKSDEVTKYGLGDVNVLSSTDTTQQATTQQKQAPSLGSVARIRKQPAVTTTAPTVPPAGSSPSTAPAAPADVPDQLDSRLKDTFERAYENVGIFEHKMSGTNRNVRVELTADSEEKVFNAISASAFLVVRNAGLENSQIDVVELFMRTTNGGAAGRFMLNRADADSINNKSISIQDYFVHKVIY